MDQKSRADSENGTYKKRKKGKPNGALPGIKRGGEDTPLKKHLLAAIWFKVDQKDKL